jgi:hypothetical protein
MTTSPAPRRNPIAPWLADRAADAHRHAEIPVQTSAELRAPVGRFRH